MRRLFIYGFAAIFMALIVVWGVVSMAETKTTGQESKTLSKHSNRLQYEKSPYLLQHKDNPVDWYPWGEEAFAKARKEDKPIFLSIGYSTCHWCHVMEHESFEDEEVAKLMNEAFVSIKVDREERPDIDNVYMTVTQMMTGSGGWPMTVIMTPDKKPFFAGTYFPKTGRGGRPGMMELIPAIRNHWLTQRDKILESADKITDQLRRSIVTQAGEELGTDALDQAYQQLRGRFDSRYGGFGGAPKFPTPHNLLFLLRHHNRSGSGDGLEMVEKTLQAMRRGGIYDHVGYGFHRYSTDQKWFLPHFEKMLYDQALLAMAYTETYQATGKAFYAETAREIFTYVLRDMTSPLGGFYSAEDADSEGEEGKFYLWSEKELKTILGKDQAELVYKVFNTEGRGSYYEQSSGHRPGTNILYLEKDWAELAKDLKIDQKSLVGKMEEARQKLFTVREKRVHPYKDDKILTDWNGLMIAALAKGGRVLGEARYTEAANKALEFIFDKLVDSKGHLLHRYRDGEAGIRCTVEDYAFLIWALLEMYETTFDVKMLSRAIELNEVLLEDFWDDENGGFFFTADDGEKLIVRQKEVYDGAIPSGNSVAMWNLLRLGRMTGEVRLEEKASALGRAFSIQVTPRASGHTLLMCAVDFAQGGFEVVIAGDPEKGDTRAMLSALRKLYLPNKVVLLRPGSEKNPAISELAAYTKFQLSMDGKATAYVCRNYVCSAPTTEVEKMLALLAKKE